MAYSGPERRIHRVYVTRNTEYHMRKDTCVAVRDRSSGRWLVRHPALRQRVQGAIRFCDNGSIRANPGLPRIGESICFENSGRDLITSCVVSVERPHLDTVSGYPLH